MFEQVGVFELICGEYHDTDAIWIYIYVCAYVSTYIYIFVIPVCAYMYTMPALAPWTPCAHAGNTRTTVWNTAIGYNATWSAQAAPTPSAYIIL